MKPKEGTAVRAWPLYLALLVLLATVASHLSLLQYAAGCRGAYPISSSSHRHSGSGGSNSSSSGKRITPAAAGQAGVAYTLTRRAISHESSSSSTDTRGAVMLSHGSSHSASAAAVQIHSMDALQAAQLDPQDSGGSAAVLGGGLRPSALGSLVTSTAAALTHGAQKGSEKKPAASGATSAGAQFAAAHGILPQAADSAPAASTDAARREAAPAAAAAAGAPAQHAAQPLSLPRVFVGVLSESRNFAARQAIRQTWGSDQRLTRVVFFILRPRTQQRVHFLRQEASEFGDVIVTSEVLESYYNCTYSVLTMLKAAGALGPSIDYLVKTDDDAYVRVTSLLEALRDLPRQRLFSGYGMRAIPTPRSGTWAIPYNTWPHEMTAPYSYGLGYVLSMDLVRQMAAGAFHAAMDADNLIRIEDVAIGVAVEAIAAWDEIAVQYDASMQYALKGCEEGAVFVQMPKVRRGWRVHADMMGCMHSRGGRCCAPQEEQQR